jgi:hypothetical protein
MGVPLLPMAFFFTSRLLALPIRRNSLGLWRAAIQPSFYYLYKSKAFTKIAIYNSQNSGFYVLPKF